MFDLYPGRGVLQASWRGNRSARGSSPCYKREAWEETGCRIKVERGITATEEYRNDLHQTSFCYLTRLVEDTGTVHLTEQESNENLQHEWVWIDDAIEKLRGCQPKSELGKFIKEQDLYLVQEARDFVKKQTGWSHWIRPALDILLGLILGLFLGLFLGLLLGRSSSRAIG